MLLSTLFPYDFLKLCRSIRFQYKNRWPDTKWISDIKLNFSVCRHILINLLFHRSTSVATTTTFAWTSIRQVLPVVSLQFLLFVCCCFLICFKGQDVLKLHRKWRFDVTVSHYEHIHIYKHTHWKRARHYVWSVEVVDKLIVLKLLTNYWSII